MSWHIPWDLAATAVICEGKNPSWLNCQVTWLEAGSVRMKQSGKFKGQQDNSESPGYRYSSVLVFILHTAGCQHRSVCSALTAVIHQAAGTTGLCQGKLWWWDWIIHSIDFTSLKQALSRKLRSNHLYLKRWALRDPILYRVQEKLMSATKCQCQCPPWLHQSPCIDSKAHDVKIFFSRSSW